MRIPTPLAALGGLLLGAIGAGSFATAAPDPGQVALPLPTYEYTYAVRCVYKGAETGIVANYKLKCKELGSEILVCAALDYERCRMELVNEMGKEGWRLMASGLEGLGPNASLTFERQTFPPPPPLPEPTPAP